MRRKKRFIQKVPKTFDQTLRTFLEETVYGVHYNLPRVSYQIVLSPVISIITNTHSTIISAQ